jgi:transcriptional regulator GlxA family with amidase domain
LNWRAIKQQRRLERACQLLRGTALPVHAVAAQSGFADADYFVRHFHAKIGASPLVWRKRGAGGTDV